MAFHDYDSWLEEGNPWENDEPPPEEPEPEEWTDRDGDEVEVIRVRS